MSAVQNSKATLEQLLGSGGSVSNLAQLGLLLRDAMNNSAASGNASAVAADAGRNLTERANTTNSAADQALALIAALSQQMGLSTADESAGISNRSDQIFSNLVGTVDRGNAIASSQGFAQALRRGMGDSTQAADQANNLTRSFSDVYSKLRETANAGAFDEANKKKAAAVQSYQAATQNAVPLQKLSVDTAKSIQERAATTAQAAAKQSGQSFTDIAGSTLIKGLMGMADKSVEKAGGFGALLESLSKGFGFDTPTQQMDESARSVYSGKSGDADQDIGFAQPEAAQPSYSGKSGDADMDIGAAQPAPVSQPDPVYQWEALPEIVADAPPPEEWQEWTLDW